jgi:hypothetical protein
VFWDIVGALLLLGFAAAVAIAAFVVVEALRARRRRPGASFLQRAAQPDADPIDDAEAVRPPGALRRRYRRWRARRRRGHRTGH